jgi:hypothetical protein
MDHQPTVLPKRPPEFEQSRIDYINHQVRELLTNYGKIDLMWFDGGKGEIPNQLVRELQPGIVINRRNGGVGDYGDSEGALPKKRFEGWFETCETSWLVMQVSVFISRQYHSKQSLKHLKYKYPVHQLLIVSFLKTGQNMQFEK